MTRKGEKAGWLAGWTGGFFWVPILAGVLVYRGKSGYGSAGMVLAGASVAAVLYCAPWRHPSTPYWKLMLAPYGMFFAAIAWAAWSFGGIEPLGFNWWNLLWLMPALSPFGFLGARKWEHSDAPPGGTPAGNSASSRAGR